MAITTSNTAVASQFLNWEDRPDLTKMYCSSAFERVKENGRTANCQSAWGGGVGGSTGEKNGQSYYWTCNCNERLLFKTRIQMLLKENPLMRVFNYLGIGAGNFQEVDGMADYINCQTDLPDDIEVHIYGIRGEESLSPSVEKVKRCVKHKIGGFPIEEMSKGFKDQKIDLEGKVDVCVSEWSFIHFVDPASVNVQACNLLREGGFFLFDGFNLLYQNQTVSYGPDNKNMTQFVIDMRWPFLTTYSNEARAGFNHFIVQRPNQLPCQIPMTYLYTHHVYDGKERQIGSECITQYNRQPQKGDQSFSWPKIDDMGKLYFGNDKSLHEFLKQNHILIKERMTWKSIYGKTTSLPLHEAIKAQEPKAAEECLQGCVDINESDEDGNTPLHLTIDYDCDDYSTFPLFLKLIELKADVNLSNGFGEKPLHRAARFDSRGGWIGKLVDAGADVNCQNASNMTPIDLAIVKVNLGGLAAFLRRKVALSSQNIEALKDPKFSWLVEQGLLQDASTGDKKTAQET